MPAGAGPPDGRWLLIKIPLRCPARRSICACRSTGSAVAEARIWLGGVSMAPVEAADAQAAVVGRSLDDATIEEAARLAYPRSKPVDNTDFTVRWRKEMTRIYVGDALRAVCPA
ncbi:MAG: hypothetical protein V3U83_08655 [Acidobacteriota bacterium]